MTQLIEMNNTAVFQIRKQNYLKAISILAKALNATRVLLSREAADRGKRKESSSTSFRCNFRRSESSSFLETFQNGIVSQRSIFKDPLYITRPRLDSELKTCELLCYVMLYNLALAHHLRATTLQNGSSQAECLQAALRLYESAYQVLLSQDIEIPLFHNMAISSNLGHIHYALGNKTNANLCYEHLLSSIVFVVDSGEGSSVKSLDGFFRNVMPLIAKVPSAPAA